jgi:hypothetical protein
MTSNGYVPMSFNGESLTSSKLNQLCNNVQYLYLNTPRVRYSANGITRDSSLKIISGKTPFTARPGYDAENIPIYFGNFFSSGSNPVVVATTEVPGYAKRKFVCVFGLGGGEIDHTGFMAQVTTHEALSQYNQIEAGGWVHWTATGL